MKRREALVLGCTAVSTLASPVQAAQSDFFGLNIGTELSLGRFNRGLLTRYWAMGVRWLRVWYNWSSLETELGAYQSQGIANELRLAKSQGFKILFVIWGTPSHAGTGDLAAVPDAERFGRYCLWLKTAFVGLVDAWEVGNETNLSKYFAGTPKQYVETLAIAYDRLRSSGSVVAAGPSGAAGASYWQALFDSGMEAHCDRVNLHPYRQRPEQSLKLVDDFMKFARKPLWITEIGLSSDRGEVAKANFLKELMPQLASRAERVFWYRGLQGAGLHPLRFGLIEGDRAQGTLVQLPASYAYARCAGITL
jgi:Glycosyl hydrolase catalytic core